MNEVWKKHPRFMEYYEVSNLGRVRMLEHYDKLGRKYQKLLKINNSTLCYRLTTYS